MQWLIQPSDSEQRLPKKTQAVIAFHVTIIIMIIMHIMHVRVLLVVWHSNTDKIVNAEYMCKAFFKQYYYMGKLFLCVQLCRYIVKQNAHIWSNRAMYIMVKHVQQIYGQILKCKCM